MSKIFSYLVLFLFTSLLAYSQQDSSLYYKIAGFVRNGYGAGVERVRLYFTNFGGTVVTDEGGYYEKELPENWTGYILIEKAGYRFVPKDLHFEEPLKMNTFFIDFVGYSLRPY